MKYELPNFAKIQMLFCEHGVEPCKLEYKIWKLFQELAPAIELANAHLKFENLHKEHPAHERAFNANDNPLVVGKI